MEPILSRPRPSYADRNTTYRRAHVRRISQVNLELRDASEKSAFDAARDQVLVWMNRRAGRRLPDDAWQGKSFLLEDVGARPAEAVAVDSPRLWAARFDDADKSVPQRVWTVEVAIAELDERSSLFGARLLCSTLGTEAPFSRSIPGLVRQVISNGQCYLTDLNVQVDPWIVGPEDVARLVDLLTSPRRHVDAIVFSLSEGTSDPNLCAASPSLVAARTLGAAHVVVLTGQASFALSEMVGKEFSVFRQAVRTYRPGFNPDGDDPYAHPLALPHVVAGWVDQHGVSFEAFLTHQALRRSVTGSDVDDRLPPFKEIRAHANRIRRDAERSGASSDSELLKLALDENEELQARIERDAEEYQGVLDSAESERDHAEQEAQKLGAMVAHLQMRIQSLENRIRDRGRTLEPDLPDKLDDLEAWAERYLAGDVTLHNRALRGARRSIYEDPTLVFRSLLLLRDHYVPMRRLVEGASAEAFEQECNALGLTESASISDNRAGEQGETYFVKFGGRNRKLDRHLKKGDKRDERYCFRLYFFWDEATRQVVVGWVPSHLDTRAT